MKIWKEKDPKTKRFKWHADFTCAHKRYPNITADSTEELYDIIDSIKRKARQRRYGLEVERDHITLHQLVEERIKELNPNKKNERRAANILS